MVRAGAVHRATSSTRWRSSGTRAVGRREGPAGSSNWSTARAESPPESRVRVALVLAGLSPVPQYDVLRQAASGSDGSTWPFPRRRSRSSTRARTTSRTARSSWTTPATPGCERPAGRSSGSAPPTCATSTPSSPASEPPCQAQKWPFRPTEGGGDDGAGLLLHLREVLGAAEGLGVDLVDVLGARRPGGEPGVLRDHLQPADRGVVAGRPGQLRGDRLAGELGGASPPPGRACPGPPSAPGWPGRRSGRRPTPRSGRSAAVCSFDGDRPVTAWISLASSASRMPSLSVVQTPPSRRRNDAPADSSPPKPTDPSSRPGTNHLKPTGTSISVPAQVGDHPVDQRARHQRLADGGVLRPARPVAEQVGDGDREEVVRVHQPAVGGDDAVPVGVGVVARGDLELVLAADQRGHGRRRRAVHPDLAVPVQRHEPPGGVDQRVDHGEVEPVPLGDRRPSSRRWRRRGDRRRCGRRPTGSRRCPPRSAGRRRRCPGSRTGDGGGAGLVQRHPADAARARPGAARWRGPAITPVASVSAGPPVGGLYLKPPSRGGLCDGVTTMPSARPVVLPRLAARIAWLTAGRGRVPVAGVDQHGHVVGGEHLERGGPGRLGEGVGVPADEQRAVVPLLGPVLADGLGGGQDVRLVEGGVEAGAAVAGGAEHHLLGRARPDRAPACSTR